MGFEMESNGARAQRYRAIWVWRISKVALRKQLPPSASKINVEVAERDFRSGALDLQNWAHSWSKTPWKALYYALSHNTVHFLHVSGYRTHHPTFDS